jgi:hypothetical protein
MPPPQLLPEPVKIPIHRIVDDEFLSDSFPDSKGSFQEDGHRLK